MAHSIETAAGQLHLFSIYLAQPHIVLLVVLLLLATAVDLRERRIPNLLVASGLIAAFAFHIIASKGQGLIFALSGLGLGMAMLLPMYALRVMGAGDVKLMGMTGAFLGMEGVFGALLASLAAGGILALAMAATKRMLPQLLANLRGIFVQYHISHITRDLSGIVRPAASVGSMPYAVAITAGTLAQLLILRY